jgi:protein phosphatase
MPGMERQPKLDIAHTTDLQPGDYFLLCSDGLLERMDDGQLLQQLSTNTPDEDKRRQIVIETEKNADNHSAWLIHIKSVTQESDDAQQKNDEATVRCNAMRYETAAIEKQSSLFSRLKKWLQ